MFDDMSNKDDALARALAELAKGVEALVGRVVELSGRVESLEAARTDLDRRHEVLRAAQRAWRPLMRVRGDLVLASEAGETCRVPLSVCRTLAAGRALDLDVVHEEAEARLVDHAGRVVARLPSAALLALPRVLSAPDARGMLELGLRFRAVRQSGAVQAESPTPTSMSPARPITGVPTSLHGRRNGGLDSDRKAGSPPDQSAASPGTRS